LARRRSDSEPESNMAPWMLTYSDMVTLLLAFFIVLYSFSNLDVQKFEQAIYSLRGALGILPRNTVLQGPDAAPPSPLSPAVDDTGLDLDWEQLRTVRDELEEAIREAGLEGLVSTEVQERGLVIRFADTVLFDLGRADLKPEALDILGQVADLLLPLPNQIRVEGHTDNLPINTAQFPSNWELSTARATSVVRHLCEEYIFPPERLGAAGYGEYHPVASNDDIEGRRLNRRVDIVVLTLPGGR